MRLQDIGNDARRQYIDARATFEAWEVARRQAEEVRANLRWKGVGGAEYLVSARGRGEKSLGVRSPETEAIYDRHTTRKIAARERLAALTAQLEQHRKLNRVFGVGRAPQILVDILCKFDDLGFAEHFLMVGTHALYAYEAAAGVRFESAALATRDLDLLWDTRKRIAFVALMKMQQSTLLGALRQVDKSFDLHPDQPYTAVNKDGFEVDVIRREPKDLDPNPLYCSDDEDDLYAVPAKRANVLLSSPRMSAVIASASGHMARMTTVSPLAFVAFKRWLAAQVDREGLKRRRDDLQADLVDELISEYLPHLRLS